MLFVINHVIYNVLYVILIYDLPYKRAGARGAGPVVNTSARSLVGGQLTSPRRQTETDLHLYTYIHTYCINTLITTTLDTF